MSLAVKAGFSSLLEQLINGRTKRMIFLTSFQARLKDEPTFDNETLHKLNEAMALVSDTSAMKLPVHLSKAIWQGKTVYDICGENVSVGKFSGESIKKVAQRVISAMPLWLRYDDKEVITKDVERLLSSQEVVFG
jgi:hypothetical protein